MEKRIISSEHAPKAVGPYSHAVAVGNLLFTSGQIGIRPSTGAVAGPGVGGRTRQSGVHDTTANCPWRIRAAGGRPSDRPRARRRRKGLQRCAASHRTA